MVRTDRDTKYNAANSLVIPNWCDVGQLAEIWRLVSRIDDDVDLCWGVQCQRALVSCSHLAMPMHKAVLFLPLTGSWSSDCTESSRGPRRTRIITQYYNTVNRQLTLTWNPNQIHNLTSTLTRTLTSPAAGINVGSPSRWGAQMLKSAFLHMKIGWPHAPTG